MTATKIRVAPRLRPGDYPCKRMELTEAERHQLANFHHLIADWVVDLLRQEDAEDDRYLQGSYPVERRPAIERLCNTLMLGRGLYLDPPEEERFSMEQFMFLATSGLILNMDRVDHDWYCNEGDRCGAVAYALGYGPWYTDVEKPKGVNWWYYENNFFVVCRHGEYVGGTRAGIDTGELWFAGDWSVWDNTAKGAGKRILYGLSHELEDLRPLHEPTVAEDDDGDEVVVEKLLVHDYDFNPLLLSQELDPFILASAVLKSRVT